MAMQEQERCSPPPLETARTASDEPQLPRLGPIAGRSAAAMATGDVMAGSGGAVEEERGPDGAPDNVRSSSSPVVSLTLLLSSVVSSDIASTEVQRKPRSHVPRAARSHPWGFKVPDLPPAPAKKKRGYRPKKRGRLCAQCRATKTSLWRTWPTDPKVTLCNACGIRVRAPGAVLPKLAHLLLPQTATTVVSEQEHPPPQEIPATATTVVLVSEQEQPPPQEIQDSETPPDSPILEPMLDFDVYLLKRTCPRRDKSPPPPPTAESAPALAPGNKTDKQEKWCLHCGTTSSLQWRTGPMGPSTLCNPCGVRYRQGRLVPEYRPRASPTFNQSEHSYKHREVLKRRAMQDHPAPPAAFQPSRNRKRRKGKGPAQVRKKRKGNNKEQNQPAQPATVAVPEVRKKRSKGKAQRLPPQPALLKLRKELKGKEKHRRAPQLAATQPLAGTDMVQQHHLPPPPPPALLPHAGNEMVLLQLLPPPPPVHPHAGYDMVRYLPQPPAQPHAGDDMEMGQHLLLLPPPALPHAGDEMVQYQLPPPPPPELPRAADDMEMERHLLPLLSALPHAGDDMEQHLLPPPLAQPHTGNELMMGQPIPPLDPFLFEGPAAPRIIDEPVVVIVIDDD